jgi:hypothetical protein
MLELYKNKKKAPLPLSAEREIAITDENIDDSVYRLYGVTDEEREIIGR